MSNLDILWTDLWTYRSVDAVVVPASEAHRQRSAHGSDRRGEAATALLLAQERRVASRRQGVSINLRRESRALGRQDGRAQAKMAQ